jgi:hypothetical protein
MKEADPVHFAGSDEPPRASSDSGRKRSGVAVGVLCFWVAAALAGGAGGAYRMATAYRRFANSALGDNIRYVELRPEPTAPAVRLARPAEIDVIRGWLKSAERSAPAGVPVRPAECPLTIVFGDGAAQTLQVGSTSPRPGGAAAEIEIRWHGYTRYADAGPVAALLQPQSAK